MAATPTTKAHIQKIRELGTLVQELRQMREWTQKELAARANMHVSTLENLEQQGTAIPSLSSIIKIAEAMGLKLSALFEEVGL